MAGIPQVITEDRASGAQVIDGSLKFDSSKSQYLKRTPTAAGNRKKNTVSFWVKRSSFGDNFQRIFNCDTGAQALQEIVFNNESSPNQDNLVSEVYIGGQSRIRTNAVLRDTGWYHIVVVYDSLNSTQADRQIIYINGERQSINNSVGVGQIDGMFSSANEHRIGNGKNYQVPFNGSLSQFYFLDGIAAGPEELGYTDPLTNTWRPKKYNVSKADIVLVGSPTYASSDFKTEGNKTSDQTGLSFGSWTSYTGAETKIFKNSTDTVFTLNIHLDGGTSDRLLWYSDNLTDWTFIGNTNPNRSYQLSGHKYYATSEGSGSTTLTAFPQNGVNSFYLPMDGNSPIGKDQSGNGNDWTPVNFGGSLELPKATGAIPVLNTNDAGTIAKPGVRTDKKTYTVTASGGNYYLDGALKPTLNAYRGSSLIFDYTGASSHPLYLSSLQDGKWNSKAYSVEFSGSDYLSIPSSSDFDFGSGDCTVECFVYITSHAGDKTIIGSWEGTTSWQLSYGADSGNDRFAFMMHDGSSTLAAISSFQSTNYVNQWVHLAGVRHGNWLKVYVNGIFGGERSISGAHTTFNAPLTIGGRSNGNQVTGYVSNIRVVKGTALYTAAFTPPSTTLTNVTGTTLLCCQESNVTTAEVSPGTITEGGFPSSSQSRQPFLYDNNHGNFGLNTLDIDTTKITIPHTAADTLYYYCHNHSGMGSSINVTTDIFKADPYAWKCMFAMASDMIDHSPEINVNSTATSFGDIHTTTPQGLRNLYGHSKKMETGGGFRIDMELTTPEADAKHKFETNDFTLECWFYQDGGNTSWQSLFRSASYNNSSLNSDGIALYGNAQTLFPYSVVSGSGQQWGQTGDVVPYKKWNHAAWTRQGGVNRIFANGILVKTFNNSNSWDNKGWEIGDVYTWNGGYQDARIYNGVAKYTESFVVPATEPDILPDTPSGITGKTNLTKITEGSVRFDGNGDYLTVPGPGTLAANSNWCMECFFYCTGDASGTYRIMSANESAQSSEYILMRIRLGQYQWSTDVANSQPINTAVFNKWTHMAFTKEGTTVRGFIDGKKIWETTDNNTVTITELITGWGYGGEYFPGFISNARFVNGSSVYTADFTPPTAPLTNITNTYLLCGQSNASANAAAVSPNISGLNNGTVWSSYFTGNHDSTHGWGTLYKASNAFDGNLSSAAIGQVDAEGLTWTAPGGGIGADATTIRIYGNDDACPDDHLKINGINYGGLITQGFNAAYTVLKGSGAVGAGITQLESVYLRDNSAGNQHYRWRALEIDGTVIVDPVAASRDAAATNFNPFADDINAIRGQETAYATWNPLESNLTLSNGNLSVTAPSGNTGTRSNVTISSGKWFWEYTVGTVAGNSYVGVSKRLDASGLSGTNYVLHGTQGNNYSTFNNQSVGSFTVTDDTFTTGMIIGCAFDFDGGNMYIYKDGVLAATYEDPANGGNFTQMGDWKAHISFNDTVTIPWETNFGQKPFKFPPPDGFQPLSLSNVQPEKVTARPDQYVDVSLWSGNGTSQTISNLKHKPDFVWIKKRAGGSARSHQLFDSVRGVYKTLHSDSTSIEDTNTNRLTAFNQNGFTVGGDDGANGSGGTFVGWTWKAGGSTGQFNIDDVGYANASDVNMNVGGLNSYNTDQTWSSGLSGSGSGGSFAEATTRAFDGDKTTRARWTGTSDPVLTASFTAISATKLRVKYHAWKSSSSASEDVMISVNGGPYVSAVEAGYISYTEVHSTPGESPIVDVSPLITGGQVSSVSVKRRGTVSTATGLTIHFIEVDDKILVDNNQTPPNVPATAATGCSIGTKQGFSIVSYTSASGDGSSTIPHGLSQTPDFVLIKNRDTAAGSQGWPVWHSAVPTSSRYLDSANPWDATEFSYVFNNTAPDSKVVTVGANSAVSSGNRFRSYGNGDDFIMYCWHNVPGLQKFGKYTANNDTNGPFIELGFRPALVVCKSTTQGQPWQVYDSKRGPENVITRGLQWNNNGVEYNTTARIDILSNGFKIRAGGGTEPNVGSNTYIYCAWAEAPSINLYGAQANAR